MPPTQAASPSAAASRRAQAPDPGRSRAGSRAKGLLRQDFAGVLVAVVALVVIIGVVHPDFLAFDQLMDILNSGSYIAILAVGMAFLLAMRELDLSVGSVYGLTALIAALLFRDAGLTPWLAALAAVLAGGLLGLFNGLLIQVFALPSIVATLATLAMFRGLTLALSNGQQVVGPGIDANFSSVIAGKVAGVPTNAIIMVVVVALGAVVLRSTTFGYRVRSVGSNPEAAAFSGIAVARVRLQALVLMGALGGLAGVMTLGYLGAADPNLGTGYELQAIAAAVIGGTPLRGGRATVVGAMLGAILLGVVASGLAYFDVPVNWSSFATGAVILAAVAIDSTLRRRRTVAGPHL